MKSKKGHYNLAFENTEVPKISVIELQELSANKNDISPTPPDYDATQQETPQRDQWSNQIEFLLSCISMSVGLGNVWRFPFVAYDHGGGAFLIPYLIVLIFIGKPLYFMELALGQFCSFGPIKVWKCVPILKGIGFCQMVSTFYLTTYYNALMATCVFYFVSCFQSVLPWTFCDSAWGADSLCADSTTITNTTTNCSSLIEQGVNTSLMTCVSNETNKYQSAAEQYYLKNVLHMSSSIEQMGLPDWRLSLCLLFCWICVFFCLIRGIKSSGKTTYFTAIFPYVVLITLLILGCTLTGAKEGILYFVTPKWEALLEARVWYKACEQSFFSLAVGFGTLTMFSSYNSFRHRVYRDALIVSLLDTLTSLLAGLTIFAILGFMAHNLGETIDKAVTLRSGLAFVAYPQALAQLDIVPQLWSCLFFVMLFTLGIGSSVSQVGNVLTVVCDEMPKVAKWKVTLAISCLCYLIGLIYVTQGGQYVLNLVDSYGAGFSVFVYAVLQVIAVMWIYGINNFCKDIEFMLNMKMNYYWKICWAFIIPVFLSIIFVYALATITPPKMDDYVYPDWCIGLSCVIAALALVQIPVWAIITVYKQKGATIYEKVRNSLNPTSDWGPRNPQDRYEWMQFKQSSNSASITH